MKNKTKVTDRRTRYTRQTIKDSFLSLLKEKPFPKITVTELCRLSEINRGTFYLHYYDIDDVLDDLLNDMITDTSSVLDHVLCSEKIGCTYPFCQRVQEDVRLQVLFFDDVASSRLLEKLCELSKEDFITHLMQNSLLTFEQAEAVLYFQMNGCLAINKRMLKNKCTNWREIQQAVDHFIRAGLESFLICDGRQSVSGKVPDRSGTPEAL